MSDTIKQQIMQHADAARPDYIDDPQGWHDVILSTMTGLSEETLTEILIEWEEHTAEREANLEQSTAAI